MQVKQYDTSKSPTPQILQVQHEKAQAATDDFAVEEGFGRFQGGARSGAPSGALAKAKPRPAPPKAKAAGNPVVAGAKARAKSAKEYMEATKLLEKASYTAHKVMTEDGLQSHDGNEDALRADPSLGLLRSRQELVRLARNSATGDEGKVASAALYAAAIEDPYLRDLRQSFLTESICQTIGSVQESRDCKLEMQPTVAAVTELAEKHTNAVILLRKIADCCLSECDSWKSNLAALAKALVQRCFA